MKCQTCGNEHQENYCPNCGEKQFHTKQLSVKHFIEETFEGFVHFDSKFFYTLKTLFVKPGELSLDFVHGRRVRSMKPVQFFLVVNLLFFFLSVGSNLYSLPLDNYLTYKPFINYHTKEIIAQKLAANGLSLNEYRQLFMERIKSESKEFIFLFVPFYGLIFYALFFWKQKFFTAHIAFAAHFVSFILLWNLLVHYLVTVPFHLVSKVNYSQAFDTFSSMLTAVVVAIYLALAIRRFYRSPAFVTIIISIAAGLSFFEFIQYYRMLLFFKIVYLK